MKHQGKIFSFLYMISLVSILLISTGCAQKQVSTHLGTGVGAVTGYTACRTLLDTNMALTAACTVVGAMWGSTLFYKNDMNTHTAIFVDTLNTAPGKRSHTNWGNSSNGNWGSVTINRSYVLNHIKCTDYESVIAITRTWPLSGIMRESEHGTACQMPDGRWEIRETTQ